MCAFGPRWLFSDYVSGVEAICNFPEEGSKVVESFNTCNVVVKKASQVKRTDW